MRTHPSISVIIPTYNRAGKLKEAIDSVLAQDYDDFELIVVDDGSTDDTLQILKAYGAKVKVIRQRNQGVSAARNRGIAAASGGLMAFLDSDDLWLPGKLTTQIDFFKKTPDALICQTEEIWIRNGVRVNPKERHRKYSGMIFEQSLALCLVSPSAVMVRRGLFEKFGLFDESLPACEDYDMWLRVSCRCPVYLINKPLIIKRGGHADQLSRQPALDKFRIQAIKKILDSQMLSADQYNTGVKMLKHKCALYAAGCRKRGRAEEAEFHETLAERYALNL
jgi:glycosyltransferase involved in cell wall biosynthesis